MAAPRWEMVSRDGHFLQTTTDLLLVTTQLEVFASLEGELVLRLADSALETQDNLLGLPDVSRGPGEETMRTHRLGLLVEDGLGLTTVTRLLSWI